MLRDDKNCTTDITVRLLLHIDTYSVEKEPFQIVVVLTNRFDTILLGEHGVLFEHLGDIFRFLVLIVGMELDARVAD